MNDGSITFVTPQEQRLQDMELKIIQLSNKVQTAERVFEITIGIIKSQDAALGAINAQLELLGIVVSELNEKLNRQKSYNRFDL